MSDPPSKSWPEDDPSFLASLDDLDRGLDGSRPEPAPVPTASPAPPPTTPPRAPRSARAPLHPPPASSAPAPLVPPGTFGDPDDPPPPLTFRQPEPGDPRAHRPLLELFPVEPADRAASPMPRTGTAVGPQLPPRSRSTPKPESAGRSRDGLTLEAFYGLRERPFSLSTDPKFQYQSAAHGRALRDVLAAIGNRTGPAVLTGPLGMGKTMLCRALVQEIDRRTVTSLVLEPLQSLDDLLKTMLVDFGVVARQAVAGAAPSRELMTGTLHAFFESLVPLQGSAVVFIDEAQNVPASVLGALDTLCPGSPGTRVLQLVLVGQPALTSLLDSPELRALNTSIARRAELGPLGADEVAPYVAHRLAIAGARTRIEFDEAATVRLFELSDGSPRTVNLLCDRAMTRGHTASADVIGEELIHAAAVDLDLEAPVDAGSGVLRTALLAVAFVLLMLAGAAGALWLWRDAVDRAVLQWEQVPVPSVEPARSVPVPLAPIPPPDDVPGDAPGNVKPPDARR